MVINKVMAYGDSRGGLHETYESAAKAELKYGKERRVDALIHVIQSRVRNGTSLHDYRWGIAGFIDDNWDHLVTIMKAHGR